MRRAVTAAYFGANIRTAATPIVVEYLERKQLAKIGIVSQTSEIPAFKCDCFLMIHSEFERLRENARKRAAMTQPKR